MSSIERARPWIGAALVALLTISIVLGITGIAGIAAGQQTQGANETANANADGEPEKLVEQVDEDVRVESYTYDEQNETFSILFSSSGDRTVDVTVTEVIDQRAGSSGTFGVEQFRIRPDERVEVEISARLTGGSAAVMIVTQKSLDAGRGTFLQYETSWSLISGAATWWLIRIAGVGGAIGVVVAVIYGAWNRVADNENSAEVVV